MAQMLKYFIDISEFTGLTLFVTVDKQSATWREANDVLIKYFAVIT